MSSTVMGSTAYGTAGNTSSSDNSSSQLSADFDTFLLLLTSQLQNQDPLEPMDSSEFTNQLVQYANVEQSIQVNSNLEEMIGLNISNLATNAVSYIGKEVQLDATAFPLQDSYAKFSYTLAEDAQKATAIISDSSGNIVHSFPTETTAGKHILDWDGQTTSGEQLPDGVYSLQISAFDPEGELMPAENIYISTYGKVTTIASDGVDIAVGLDDVVITLDKILSIHERKLPTTETSPELEGDKDENIEGEGEVGTDNNTNTETEKALNAA